MSKLMDVKMIAEECLKIWREVNINSMWFESIRRLYSDDAVNIEPMPWLDIPSKVKSKQAILQKYERCSEILEEHNYRFEGPFYRNHQFALRIEGDLTAKMTGKRITVSEVGLYTVEDSKVVKEEFLYDEALSAMWGELNDLWSKQKE